MTNRLLLLDANSLLHRAFHALPSLTTSLGEQTGAVYGFTLALLKAIGAFRPLWIVAAFDMAAPTLRHQAFKEYKATRVKAPEELYMQVASVKELLNALHIPVLEKEGFEADDIIGTVANMARQGKLKSVEETVILSGDMDTLQLVDEHTKVSAMKKGIKDSVLFDEQEAQKKFGGLRPGQIPDLKGLCGDASDNIPGVRGVGEKTAVKLLLEFGSLEGVLRAAEKESRSSMNEKLAHTLMEHAQDALMSRDLAVIRKDVPVSLDIREAQWRDFSYDEAFKLFWRFEFKTLIPKLQELKNGNGQASGPVQTSLHDVPSEHDDTMARIEELFLHGVFSKEIYELERRLFPVVRAMEERGIGIDKAYLQSLAKEIEKEISALEKTVYKEAGATFNINSPKQLSEILFEKLQLSVKKIKKTPGGVLSTASNELEKLKDLHPVVSHVLKYRELAKLLTTYLLPLPELADEKGRVHSRFDQLGAASGRLSSSRPNLQNIPNQGEWAARIRKGFVSDKGFSFLALDYSQIDLRVAAHMADVKKMREYFQEKKDIHRMTAAEVFGVPESKVADDMRFRAKALNFGVLYGMGARSFSASTGVSLQEAQDFIDLYFARFPEVAEYASRVKEFAREHGYVETMFGRKRFIPEINSGTPQVRAAAERIAMNHPIQGTSADIMKKAMVFIQDEILRENPSCRMLLQIHDELLFECPDDTIRSVAPRIRDVMERACTLAVPLAVKVSAGKDWGTMSPLFV